MTCHSSTQTFTPSQMLQASAEASLGIEPQDLSPAIMDTGLFRGRLLVREVQPGLILTANDVICQIDRSITVEVEPSIVCGIQLAGAPQAMTVDGRHAVAKKLNAPVIVGYGRRSTCAWTAVPGSHSASVGFTIRPRFFDRFGALVADDGIAALHDILGREFHTEVLAPSGQLVERARRVLDHAYTGTLAGLFLESSTLHLVTEIADQLSRRGALVAALGHRHYDRMMEARAILDADLIAPPATLELARRVGTNVTTLQRSFRMAFGTTIFGYVRQQRLSVARILLVDHGVAVAEAGRKVGFASPSAFSVAYKQQFGHLPRAAGSGRAG